MSDKSQLRSQLFKHLDGLVTAPLAYSLHKKGILEKLLQEKELYLNKIAQEINANDGYLNTAFRVLASQGFINYELIEKSENVRISLNSKSAIAFQYFKYYEDIVIWSELSGNYPEGSFDEVPYEMQRAIIKKIQNRYYFEASNNEIETEIQEQILIHITGNIVAPMLVKLGMNGMFHKYFMETRFKPEEFHKQPEKFSEILDFFVFLGWFKNFNGFYEFTEDGLFFAKKASSYGVTTSYLPIFRNVDELLFGNPNILKNNTFDEFEKHVDREMNVWGSGGAHATYFKVIDTIIIELFNRPINEQPKGILDMGCGNGAFLEHLFNLIDRNTLRGKMLDEYPLFLVGADYNQAALKVTRANLINADIWAKVIWGDIGKPDLLAEDLKQNYAIELEDLLNVRTFLDHNRIWEQPASITIENTKSTGAFASRGKRLNPSLVAENLKNHFLKWKPYVDKFGLLVIELHTIAPEITSRNLGKTAATAYDATHGFSDQYILEIETFQKVVNAAGLKIDPTAFVKFPNSALATVSIHLIR